jgi:hypothetical protein
MARSEEKGVSSETNNQTFMTADEVYKLLADEVQAKADGNWSRVVLLAELIDDSIGYSGWIYSEDGTRKSLSTNFPFTVWDAIEELHTITTEGGGNRWNCLRYTLWPNSEFEADFIWDEDRAEVMAYIQSSKNVPEPRRSDGLNRLKKDQLERRTAHIYDAIAQSLLRNEPDGEWQQLVLKLT